MSLDAESLPPGFVQDVQFRLRELKEGHGPASAAFPSTLCSAERKFIHLAAKKAQLFSRSQGDGDARYIEVFREGSALTANELAASSRAMLREEKLSRMLSSVLRHRAQDLGLSVRSDGFVRVEDVLSLPSFESGCCTAQDIQAVADGCKKARFTILVEDGELWVRANQGHTISNVADTALLVQVSDPDELRICVHGTYFVHWASILKKGLCAMSRNHIHFVARDPGQQVVSGMRVDVQLALYVDAGRAMADGCEFFQSANGVILSRGFDGTLPASYFVKAVALSNGFGHAAGSVVFQRERSVDTPPGGAPRKEVACAPLEATGWLDAGAAAAAGWGDAAPPYDAASDSTASEEEQVLLKGPLLA